MEMLCNDVAFGKMAYKHRWFKLQKVILFGKEKEVTIAAKAYSGKSITEQQRESYKWFCENKVEVIKLVENKLQEYSRLVEVNEVEKKVTLKTVLFKQDGTTIFLLDCEWDMEHGVAVKVMPEVAVGSQDLFL